MEFLEAEDACEGGNMEAEEEAVIGFWSAFGWLDEMTVFIALLSEYVVDTIENASDSWGLSVSFLSIILLPIVGNAAEHAGAIIFAFKNMLSRPGIQMRMNSWQDGVLGTNCLIPPKWNWTYQFQVKDQSGSFFYSPSTNFRRASGGFGPYDENFIMIGDWYKQNHVDLRSKLNAGKLSEFQM
ncbi:monocopper oxidase-like protein SKS1-like, partial [Trifolium pratense]